MTNGSCARTEPEISALLDGELAGTEAAAVEAHVRSCAACAALARDLAAVSRTLRGLDGEGARGDVDRALVSPAFRARVLAGIAGEPPRLPAGPPRGRARRSAPSRRPVLRFVLPAVASAAGVIALLSAGTLLWSGLEVAVPGPSGTDGTGTPVATGPADAASYLARAAAHEREGRADLARRDALAAYGLDPDAPRVREAVDRLLGFDPGALESGPAPLAAAGPRPAGDGPGAVAAPGPEGTRGREPDWIGSWRFDSPDAYDRFLEFRDRSRELELAQAAREAQVAETTTVAPERKTPEAPNPLARTLASLRVGRPVGGGGGTLAAYDGLTLYPLRPEGIPGLEGPAPLALKEALSQGRAEVRDPLRSNASSVWVSNHATDRPLLVLAGEVLEGGRADRMVARDVLVPPGARNLPVPVYDVEVGRASTTWGSRFRVTPGVGGAMLRGLALAQASPETVSWFVRDRLELLFVKKSRRSLVDAFDERGPVQPILRVVRPQVAELVEGIRPEDVTGFAVAHGRHLLALEVFGSHELMMRHAPRLLEGYALEASTFVSGGLPPTPEAVEEMVRAAGRGAFFKGPAGEASEYGVVSSEGSLLGSGVAGRGGLYHASVLNGAGAAAIRGDREGRSGDFPGGLAGPDGGVPGSGGSAPPPGSGAAGGGGGAEGSTSSGSEGGSPGPPQPAETDR